jgi:signal peptidase I
VSLLIYLVVFYILLSLSLYKLFPKAGIPATMGLIPGLNFVHWSTLIGRKPAYALWLLFPIVNIFIFCGMAVDLGRSFGRKDFIHSAIAVLYAPLLFFSVARDKKASYNGPILKEEKAYADQLKAAQQSKNEYEFKKLTANNPFKKNPLREWVESIVFAVFAAAFIRMFLIEAYVIPTGSMEGSLLVGDYLFVSKVSYGLRTPQTVLQVPLMHNRLPFGEKESYLSKPALPYARWFRWNDVERFDPVVFNYPEGDSVFVIPGRTYSIHDFRRIKALQDARIDQRYPLTVRPPDKADHYIKRAIGMPGDSLEIRNGQVYVNGEALANPPGMQMKYIVKTETTVLHKKRLEEIKVNIHEVVENRGAWVMALSQDQVEKIKSWGPDITVVPEPKFPDPKYLFPHREEINGQWTLDNYGPIYIPAKGETVALNEHNLAFLERVIRVYEGNDLVKKEGVYYLNGAPADQYTFRQNYYWMMGDNRHSSEDARMWGYTPEEYVVGKPLFIFFSTQYGSMKNGIRWNRLFRSATMMDPL